MASKSSSPASAFTKVLRSFETGGFTSRDVVIELKRLLKAGASPNELSEILRRREFVEPLPVDAHEEVLGLLEAAKERAAAVAGEQPAEGTGAGRKTIIQLAPPPRIPDPAPAPESESSETKLITVPVKIPAARTTRAPPPAQAPRSAVASNRPPADGLVNVVARAITLARTSASPARASALPDSMRRRTRRIAPAATPPLSTSIPPAEKRVTDGKPVQAELSAQAELAAQAESRASDDWSDLAVLRQNPASAPLAQGSTLKARGASSRGSTARVIGWSAVALATAAVAWFVARHAPLPTNPAGAAAPPIPGTLIRDCPTCAAMMVLPAARFKQGYADTDRGALSYEMPEHWVNITRSFAMSADLVTVEDYRRFVAATGRALQGCETYDGSWTYRPENNWQNPGFAQSGLHPVTCVSWDDAVAYTQWLSAKTGHRYRLPSASEWEYTARAGRETVYPWASNGSNACAFANVADASAAHRYPGLTVFACDDGYANTSPVGSFNANALGINDMLGNVFQWTQDCWHADYRDAPVDGSARTDGDCSERELRGGSWFTSPSYVRADYRNHFAADYRTSSVGIRLVRDLRP